MMKMKNPPFVHKAHKGWATHGENRISGSLALLGMTIRLRWRRDRRGILRCAQDDGTQCDGELMQNRLRSRNECGDGQDWWVGGQGLPSELLIVGMLVTRGK